jgi:hypothetical protein
LLSQVAVAVVEIHKMVISLLAVAVLEGTELHGQLPVVVVQQKVNYN